MASAFLRLGGFAIGGNHSHRVQNGAKGQKSLRIIYLPLSPGFCHLIYLPPLSFSLRRKKGQKVDIFPISFAETREIVYALKKVLIKYVVSTFILMKYFVHFILHFTYTSSITFRDFCEKM